MIVAESLAANVSITGIARRHSIGTGQLYGWRHQLPGRRSGEATGFARVAIAHGARRLSAPVTALAAGPSGLIEIRLPGGVTVRVDVSGARGGAGASYHRPRKRARSLTLKEDLWGKVSQGRGLSRSHMNTEALHPTRAPRAAQRVVISNTG